MTVASTTPQPEAVVLRVSASTAPQSAAAAISKSISDSHVYPDVRAIGHGAIGQATKALAIARGYVAQRGIDLAFTVGFDTVKNDNGQELSAIVYHCFPR